MPASNVSAVVLNVTATEATAAGFVTVWPEGAQPLASSLNVDEVGQTRPNLVTVPVGSDGAVRLFTQSGAHLLADVVGYYQPAATARAGRLQTVAPARLLDTRSGSKPGAGATVSLAVAGQGGVPSSGVAAIVLNVTATDATAPGYVTVWPEGSQPATSNLNVDAAGQTVANQVIVPLGSDGAVRLFTQSGAHLLADVTGWYTTSRAADATQGLFVPVSPYRVLDTRTGSQRGAGSTLLLLVAADGTAAAGKGGVVMNLTATEPSAAGFVTAWPEGSQPTVSSMNVTGSGQTIANHVVSGVGSDGGIRLFTYSATHLVADVTGWFLT
jgi:hypothetical protein